jgi:hypothetical protein
MSIAVLIRACNYRCSVKVRRIAVTICSACEYSGMCKRDTCPSMQCTHGSGLQYMRYMHADKCTYIDSGYTVCYCTLLV